MSCIVDEPPDDYPHFCSICGEPDDKKNSIQLMRTLSVMSLIIGQSLNQILQRNTGTIQYLSTGSAVSGGTRWVAGFYARYVRMRGPRRIL